VKLAAVPQIAGRAEGEVLKLEQPISFWGGVDPKSGRISDPRHPDHDREIAGRILVLPGMRADAVDQKIVALSALASEVSWMVCGESLISASVGVASWPDDGATADELLAEADRRMYANKNSLRLKRSNTRAIEDLTVALQ